MMGYYTLTYKCPICGEVITAELVRELIKAQEES